MLGVRTMPSEEQAPFSQTGDLLTLQTQPGAAWPHGSLDALKEM